MRFELSLTAKSNAESAQHILIRIEGDRQRSTYVFPDSSVGVQLSHYFGRQTGTYIVYLGLKVTTAIEKTHRCRVGIQQAMNTINSSNDT